MNEKPYRLLITQLKELHGAIVIDQKITEEQFIWIIDFLHTHPQNKPQKEGEDEQL